LLQRLIDSSSRPDEVRGLLKTLNPLPGVVSIECVAASALFLVSDDAAFITGVALPIDGGSSAGRKLY
jgi:enoyl-[acyl-carrier-protein] reductase (NADH)